MADGVKFEDYTAAVEGKLDEIAIAWLEEVGAEVASQCKRNCQMDGEVGGKLRGSYSHKVNESKGEVNIGSSEEAVFWEEFGTGAFADTAKNGGKKGRQGWWVYVKGGSWYKGSTQHYDSQREAEAAAAYIRKKYRVEAIATNGRKPAYTLLNALNMTGDKAQQALEEKLKSGMEDKK